MDCNYIRFIKLLTLFLFCCCFMLVNTASCYAQYQERLLDKALENFEKGNYEGVLKAVNSFLLTNPGNLDSIKLKDQIQKKIKSKKSYKLTELALIEIENKNFRKAQVLLTEALKLDANNKRARELYLAMDEVSKIEGGFLGGEDIISAEKEQRTKDKNHLKQNFYIQLAPQLAFSGSNAVAGLDSGVMHLGTRLDIAYIPKIKDQKNTFFQHVCPDI